MTLQQGLNVPQAHFDVCKAANIPTVGNAAGNTIDWLDLTGQNSPPPPLPAGFTGRGIIALIISILNGVFGTVIIIWYSYGESDTTNDEGQGFARGDNMGRDENDESINGDGNENYRIPNETARLLNN